MTNNKAPDMHPIPCTMKIGPTVFLRGCPLYAVLEAIERQMGYAVKYKNHPENQAQIEDGRRAIFGPYIPSQNGGEFNEINGKIELQKYRLDSLVEALYEFVK